MYSDSQATLHGQPCFRVCDTGREGRGATTITAHASPSCCLCLFSAPGKGVERGRTRPRPPPPCPHGYIASHWKQCPYHHQPFPRCSCTLLGPDHDYHHDIDLMYAYHHLVYLTTPSYHRPLGAPALTPRTLDHGIMGPYTTTPSLEAPEGTAAGTRTSEVYHCIAYKYKQA